jgi:hypothetical protein
MLMWGLRLQSLALNDRMWVVRARLQLSEASDANITSYTKYLSEFIRGWQSGSSSSRIALFLTTTVTFQTSQQHQVSSNYMLHYHY